MKMHEGGATSLFVLTVAILSAGRSAGAGMPEPVVSLSFDRAETFLRDAGGAKVAFAKRGEVLLDPRGVKGGCAYFDGRSWLEAKGFPQGLGTGSAPYTVSAWMRTADGCPSAGGWVSWGAKAKGRGNSLRLNGPEAIHNYWNDVDLTVTAPGIGNGRWHFVTATYDGRRRTVYMDGLPRGSGEGAADIGDELFLVGRTMHDVGFKGWIDELSVCGSAVDDAGAFELYRAALTPEAFSNERPHPPEPVLRAAAVAESPKELARNGFAVRMRIDLASVKEDETLWTMGPARLALRMAGRDPALAAYDERWGNYLNFRQEDGTCPVLEATICEKAGRIGVPLGAIVPGGACEVTLRYAPPSWRIEVGGETDEEFPTPQHPIVWRGTSEARVHSPRVSGESFASPAGPQAPEPDSRDVTRSIQYWTPDGFNQWVGDVAPGCFEGSLHVFYLIDRRHHRSGAGGGRHQFAHLTSDDLVHWRELPLAVPITEEWQTVGTGTPFVKDGRLALAFGWHTDRFCTPSKERPMGGTYAISEDGVHFRWTKEMISDAQNPSIYNLAGGGYELVTSYGGSIGIFHSTDLKDWRLFDAKLPFRGDCPSLFDWQGRRYLLQGFRNMAYSPDGKPGTFVNWTDRPDKLYDGLSVPMVVSWKGDRRLYIGWLNHLYGWGGWLVFRELVSYPDGVLGMKWVPEIEPPTKPMTFEVAGGAAFSRRFARVNGKASDLVLSVDPQRRTAEFVDDDPSAKVESAEHAQNVRIGGVRGLEKPYRVRLIVHYDPKANATLFDAEIAGQRTIICRRAGKFSLK